MNSSTQRDLLLGAVIGTFIGATVTLLLTPYSGKDVIRKVQKRLKSINGKNIRKFANNIIHERSHNTSRVKISNNGSALKKRRNNKKTASKTKRTQA